MRDLSNDDKDNEWYKLFGSRIWLETIDVNEVSKIDELFNSLIDKPLT